MAALSADRIVAAQTTFRALADETPVETDRRVSAMARSVADISYACLRRGEDILCGYVLGFPGIQAHGPTMGRCLGPFGGARLIDPQYRSVYDLLHAPIQPFISRRTSDQTDGV